MVGEHRVDRRVGRGRWPDLLIAGALALLTFVVHDVGYMLHAPYWNDEVWVAVSTKVGWHEVPAVVASSPIGWDVLLRLAPAGHPQAGRLIPLGFAALTVLLAYGFVRCLPWPTVARARFMATAAAVMALLAPSALIRNDLKQYTCDACCVLAILWLTLRAERSQSTRAWADLVLGGAALFLFANPAALALVACLACLGLQTLLHRDLPLIRRAALWSGVAVVLLVGIYLAFYARGNLGGLRTYWATNFPPWADGPSAVWAWLCRVGPGWFHGVGLGPACVALPLAAFGAMRIAGLGLPATAAAVPMLFGEVLVLTSLRLYPAFDPRTMHFLAIPMAMLGAVGCLGLLLRVRPSSIAPALAGAAVLGVGVWHAADARQHDIPIQATRQDVQAIKDGWQQGDALLTNTNGSWALAYYWGGAVEVTPTSNTMQKFRSQSVLQPETFYTCPEADYGGVPATSCFAPATMTAALDRIRAARGPAARIWVERLQAGVAVEQAIKDWASAHRYSVRWPARVRGSYVLLLTPEPVVISK